MSDDLQPIRILDVIRTTAFGGRHVQWFVLVDRMPVRVYHRDGNSLTSNDSGFYDFLGIQPGSSGAFGGRKFTVRLEDGSDFECHGQVWSCGAPAGTDPTLAVGIATKEQLDECYVFMGASMSKALLEDWLSKYTPSSNYRKHDRKESFEYWLDLVSRPDMGGLRKIISAPRARTLRRRGVTILRVGGSISWSSFLEKKKAAQALRECCMSDAIHPTMRGFMWFAPPPPKPAPQPQQPPAPAQVKEPA